MRLLHTADWHLGRLFHGNHLTADQAHVLDQLVEVAADGAVDAVLIAGDVYDRSVPPVEAVELLDATLERLILELEIPVVLIAGNHDSPGRLGFASELLSQQGLHVCGSVLSPPARIDLETGEGRLAIHAIPFAEPKLVREVTGADDVHTHQAAVETLLSRVELGAGCPNVLVGHAYVVGGEASESERPLSVGSATEIDAGAFSAFDYVALGHLHRPQWVGSRKIRYSGSLLKYSFSEAEDEKSVTIVEMGAPGSPPKIETVPLTPLRDVRILRGHLRDLTAAPDPSVGREDFLRVDLEDRKPVYDPMGKLREVYPNVAAVRRLQLMDPARVAKAGSDRRKMSDRELFEAFWLEVTGEEPTEDARTAFLSVLEEVNPDEAEV